MPQTAGWSEVVGKKAKNKVTATTARNPIGATQKPVEGKRRGVRSMPAAIMVNVDNQEDFLELVKKIRGGVNPEVMGERVVGMRKTKSGRLLIEVKGDTDEVEAVRAEVSKSAGDGIEVRFLQQKSMLEIRDLDQWTMADEVTDAVAVATGASRDTLRVISLRKGYGGVQTALVLVPTARCRNVVEHGRLRVGMVNCRIRQGERKIRCFRCLSFGHMSSQCKGSDRSQCCRRCGEVGHKADVCSAPTTAANVFARVVDGGDATQ